MRSWYFTSESVTEGHPDKIADRISDGVLDAVLAEDPHGRVACEVLLTDNRVIVAGEITTSAIIDVEDAVRQSIREAGYDDPRGPFAADTCDVEVIVKRQSPDIAGGVSQSLELRNGSTDPFDALGAGDQGIMFGFAVDETPERMPLSIQLAHRLAEQLANVRKDQTLGYLGPDGKTQVTVRYQGSRPVGVHRVLISTQHDEDFDPAGLEADLRKHVLEPVLPDPGGEYELIVNPSGRFVVGGPVGDTGLTGRKVIVDTYGGAARHGGGCFSGKDPTKVDRSAAYAARHAARNLVAAGLVGRCELQLSYAIGRAKPFSTFLETFGTETLPIHRIERLIAENFDFRPLAMINRYGLQRPIYKETSAYGHFGRPQFSWEAEDVAATLADAAASS
ncbi:MAG: methionine adenosyltransferase [Acidimicrobiia bacterium]|nr:methionine adenosyltransferase [Acidimicrobiia bacterium]